MPADLLKLYIYGYLDRVRSSRRLEAETVKAPRRRGGNLVGKAAFAQIEFATDSPLEEAGFEVIVPGHHAASYSRFVLLRALACS